MLNAIETRYAGRRFRSRREARWAILFDHLEIDWRYEPEGYELRNKIFYLPDFELHLPSGRMWVEVKPDLEQYRQLSLLAEASEQVGILVAEPMIRANVLPVRTNGVWAQEMSVGRWLSQIANGDSLTIQAASNAALSARWEHGEKPRRPRQPGGRGPRAYQRSERLLDEPSGTGSSFVFGS